MQKGHVPWGRRIFDLLFIVAGVFISGYGMVRLVEALTSAAPPDVGEPWQRIVSPILLMMIGLLNIAGSCARWWVDTRTSRPADQSEPDDLQTPDV